MLEFTQFTVFKPLIDSRPSTGINVTNGDEVAVKLESSKARHPQLIYEARVYKVLQGGMGKFEFV